MTWIWCEFVIDWYKSIFGSSCRWIIPKMFWSTLSIMQIILHFPGLFVRLGSVYTKCKILNILKFGQNQIYSSITYYASPTCPTKAGPVQHPSQLYIRLSRVWTAKVRMGKLSKTFQMIHTCSLPSSISTRAEFYF